MTVQFINSSSLVQQQNRSPIRETNIHSFSSFVHINYDPQGLPHVVVGSDSLLPHPLQVFFGLPLGFITSTSQSMHFFTQSFLSFLETCPYHLSLFRGTNIVANYIICSRSLSLSLSLNSLHADSYCYVNATHPLNHSHLSPLKCQLILFFRLLPSLTAM